MRKTKSTRRQERTMSSRRQVPPVMMVGEVNYQLENILQQKEKIFQHNSYNIFCMDYNQRLC